MYGRPKAVADFWYHGDNVLGWEPVGMTIHDGGPEPPRDTGLLWPNGDKIVWVEEKHPMGFDMRGRDEA